MDYEEIKKRESTEQDPNGSPSAKKSRMSNGEDTQQAIDAANNQKVASESNEQEIAPVEKSDDDTVSSQNDGSMTAAGKSNDLIDLSKNLPTNMHGNPFIDALAFVMGGATKAITSTIIQSNNNLYERLTHRPPNATDQHSTITNITNTAIKAAVNLSINASQPPNSPKPTPGCPSKQIEAPKYPLTVKLNETTDVNTVRSTIRDSGLLDKDGINFESSRVKRETNEYEFVCGSEEDRTRVIDALKNKGLACITSCSGQI